MQHLQDEEGANTADGNNVSKLSADERSVHSTTSTHSRNRRNRNSIRQNQDRTQENYNLRPSWYQHFQYTETYISGTLVTDDIVNNQSGKFGYLKDDIILDTGSSFPAKFINPNLDTNIIVNKNPITMQT